MSYIQLGEGSIKAIDKGKRYEIRFQMPDGTKSPRRYIRGNMADAKRARDEYRAELEMKLNSIGTVADYARKWHMDRWAAGTLAQNTLIKDNSTIDHICEQYPDVLMEELTPEHIEEVNAKLRKQGWSQDAIFKLNAKLSQIFKHALERGRIKYNPCVCIDNKRPKANEKHSLSIAQFKKTIGILETTPKTGETVAVYLALMAGLRKGEALGLEWQYVDLDNKSISVMYQYSRSKSHQPLKTKYSIRGIVIADRVVEFLREWKQWQSENIFNGEPVPNHYPVCSHYSKTKDFDKAHLVLTPFRNWLIKFLKKHDITYEDCGETKVYTFHELRHSHATLQAYSNMPVKVLQKRMGHADIATTMNIYTHMFTQQERETANLLDKVLE